MKAKHLVSMLLAGSMILGLAACAPTTNSGGGNDSPQPTGTDSGSGGASSEYLVYNVGEEPKTWDPQLNTSSMGGHVILNLYDATPGTASRWHPPSATSSRPTPTALRTPCTPSICGTA